MFITYSCVNTINTRTGLFISTACLRVIGYNIAVLVQTHSSFSPVINNLIYITLWCVNLIMLLLIRDEDETQSKYEATNSVYECQFKYLHRTCNFILEFNIISSVTTSMGHLHSCA